MLVALWTLALLTTGAAFFLSYRSDVRKAVPYPWLTAGLRALLLALVWALLLAPSVHITKSETQKPVVLLLQDESASIPIALKGDTSTYTRDARELIAKLSSKYRVLTWGFGGEVRPDSLFRFREPTTDISAPLSRASEAFGGQNLGAIILATDGRFNQGVHPLYQALSLNSPLYCVSIGDTSLPKDLRIPQVYAPRTVAKDAQVEVRADVVATMCNGYDGNVQISEGGQLLGSSPIAVAGARYDKSVGFSIKAGTPGLHHYVITVPTAEGEVNTANNRRDVFIEVVEAKKRILLAAAAPHPDVAAIREALSGADAYTLSVRVGEGLPADLSSYEVVILHNIPSSAAPQLRGKAVWYIVGDGLGPVTTPAAELNVAPGMHDAYAAVNPGFGAFTIPQGFASVLERMPPLSAPSGEARPMGGTQVLLRDKNGNAPLWMLQPGAAPQAVLLGEGLWRWRLYEYRYFHNHATVDECIRQTIAMLAANTSDNPFRVSLPKYEWSDAENIGFDGYLMNAAGEEINTPDAALTIKDSAGKSQSYSFERSGAAYRLNIGRLPAGSYTFSAVTAFNSKHYAAAGSFVVASVPLEAMETGADYGLLYSLSKKYGGSTVRNQQIQSLYDSISRNENIKPVIESRDTTVPLIDWKWYFFLILLVATVEWLLRKYWLAQ